MAQLNVKLASEQLEALRRYATQRRTPISWLIKDYIDYLLAGGKPIEPPPPSAMELAALAQHGGSFDWLADEPDLYDDADLPPPPPPRRAG